MGTPLALWRAQSHWGRVPIVQQFLRAITFFPGRTYYGFPGMGGPSRPPFNDLEIFLQSVETIFALLLVLALVNAQARTTPRYFTVCALLIVAAYYWFNASVQGPVNGWRLLYLAIPAFLGAGAAARTLPRVMSALVLLLAAVLASQIAFTTAGYFVI
ncbi:MAG: hypothetical protein M0027_15620 [Candidatus Dormibacteraeota bacterium]|nr:hypothetical protein [Candidatus Dormibacteraeota bacterium]